MTELDLGDTPTQSPLEAFIAKHGIIVSPPYHKDTGKGGALVKQWTAEREDSWLRASGESRLDAIHQLASTLRLDGWDKISWR